MTDWNNKKTVTREQIQPLCSKYGVSQLMASILYRRGITQGSDILFYLEDDLRFQHNPFCFSTMEDAVERIISAKEEKEKVLIFGDSDVDGITSTAILFSFLKDFGLDVSYRIPLDEEAYGLSKEAIEEHAKNDGTLIITVDCGISNFEEIDYAQSLGIDVIVTDHHNPQETLPNATIIVNPKVEDCNYPFKDISGAAVAYKLVSALRFSITDFYNAEICILDVNYNEQEKVFYIDCVKIKNLVKEKTLHEKIIPGKTSIYDLKLPYFLQGQLIYSWNVAQTKEALFTLFGKGVEFNINDLQLEVSKIFPSFKSKTKEELVNLSSIAKYYESEKNILNALYNIYVTYCKKIIQQKYPNQIQTEKKDIQLVSLAALADVMPMKNENRLFVKNGLFIIKKEGPCIGLKEIFNKLKLNAESITSKDLSWTLNPTLNAAGRMGKADLALKLIISEDPKERDYLANELFDLNEKRKDDVSIATYKTKEEAKKSLQENNNNLIVVFDEEINHGVTGIVAARIMQENNVPSIVVTYSADCCIGSMRSCRGIIAPDFLRTFGNFFINFGGHDAAAGFSFTKDKLPEFLNLVKQKSKEIKLLDTNTQTPIDAEIPSSCMDAQVFDLLEKFEPYGNENPELMIISNNLKLIDAICIGKKEPFSLKLTFECEKAKIPALFWKQGDLLNKELFIGQNYDIIYNLDRNYYNGISTPQIILNGIRKSK